MEDVGIFYVPLVDVMTIWYILWSFGIFYGYLVYFSRLGRLYQKKSGNPAHEFQLRSNFRFLELAQLP
jgi:hypothetical protein